MLLTGWHEAYGQRIERLVLINTCCLRSHLHDDVDNIEHEVPQISHQPVHWIIEAMHLHHHAQPLFLLICKQTAPSFLLLTTGLCQLANSLAWLQLINSMVNVEQKQPARTHSLAMPPVSAPCTSFVPALSLTRWHIWMPEQPQIACQTQRDGSQPKTHSSTLHPIPLHLTCKPLTPLHCPALPCPTLAPCLLLLPLPPLTHKLLQEGWQQKLHDPREEQRAQQL